QSSQKSMTTSRDALLYLPLYLRLGLYLGHLSLSWLFFAYLVFSDVWLGAFSWLSFSTFYHRLRHQYSDSHPKASNGLVLCQIRSLYGSDLFYSWYRQVSRSLRSRLHLMYAHHKYGIALLERRQ